MSRMAVICDSQVIEESDLPYDFALATASEETEDEERSLEAAMLAFEKNFIRKALKRTNWQKKLAAQELQIGYSTLKGKLKAYGLAHDTDGDDE